MMRRLIAMMLAVTILGGAVVANRLAAPGEATKAAAVALFKSLSEEQRQAALLAVDDQDRYREEFPAVTRKGLSFDKLNADQKKLVDEVVRVLCSEYGATRCLEVAKQTPDNRRYITFYGNPEKDASFAWRLAQHHLTLIYAEFGEDKVNEFGPVLLGGNPVKELWDEEDKILLELYSALTPEEQKSIGKILKGSGGSGQMIGDSGIRIGDLNSKAKPLAKSLLEKRLAIFSADRQKTLLGIIDKDGGVENLRVLITAPADKSYKNGGKYNWKIGGPSVVCDWQTAGTQHIHMTVRGKIKG